MKAIKKFGALVDIDDLWLGYYIMAYPLIDGKACLKLWELLKDNRFNVFQISKSLFNGKNEYAEKLMHITADLVQCGYPIQNKNKFLKKIRNVFSQISH